MVFHMSLDDTMTVRGIDRDLLRTLAFLILDLMGRLVPEMRADMLDRLQQHSSILKWVGRCTAS